MVFDLNSLFFDGLHLIILIKDRDKKQKKSQYLGLFNFVFHISE